MGSEMCIRDREHSFVAIEGEDSRELESDELAKLFDVVVALS